VALRCGATGLMVGLARSRRRFIRGDWIGFLEWSAVGGVRVKIPRRAVEWQAVCARQIFGRAAPRLASPRRLLLGCATACHRHRGC
jgi:hypothetical protein